MNPAPLKMWIAALICVASIALLYAKLHVPRILGNYAAGEPEQNNGEQARPFELKGMQLTPVAKFRVRARLLSAHRYSSGTESELSPIDFALGWNRMSDDAVLRQLDLRQDSRFYYYRWRGTPPIPVQEMIVSSANMHLIPASEEVADTLKSARPGEVVTLSGSLVDVDGKNGWYWHTSRVRTDTGNHACEIVWVEAASIEEHAVKLENP